MVADTNSSQHPRDRLIAAAMAMFHAHGYHSVGVQTLCEQAEVAKGSFYHFFESKEELTIAAVQEAWDRFKATVILPSMAMGGTAEERVRGIRRGCLDPSHRALPACCCVDTSTPATYNLPRKQFPVGRYGKQGPRYDVLVGPRSLDKDCRPGSRRSTRRGVGGQFQDPVVDNPCTNGVRRTKRGRTRRPWARPSPSAPAGAV